MVRTRIDIYDMLSCKVLAAQANCHKIHKEFAKAVMTHGDWRSMRQLEPRWFFRVILK
jgi:hypothetical protein